jgi:hypothetical protein
MIIFLVSVILSITTYQIIAFTGQNKLAIAATNNNCDIEITALRTYIDCDNNIAIDE